MREVLYTRPEPNDTPVERAEKKNTSSKAQRLLNHKNRKIKLQMLLAANFKPTDYFLTFTYADEHLPATYQEARIHIRRDFNDKLRNQRKKQGIDYKYVYCTENRHGDARIHHHAVINASGRGFAADMEEIQSLWTYGNVEVVCLIEKHSYVKAPDSVDFGEIAGYMVKEAMDGKPVGSQSYTSSKNLVIPKPQTEHVDNSVTVITRIPLGAIIISKDISETEYCSCEYVEYLLPLRTNRKKRACPV